MRVEKNVPEIRFEDFAGEWLDTTLSDVIDVRSGKDYKHLGKGNIPVYGTGGYMLSVDSALSNDEDAIGIGRKGTIDKPYLLRAPFWTVDTLFYAVPKPKFKLDYLYCLFQKIDWKKHDESTGVPSLSKVAINNIPVRVTSETEQTAIGNTFQKLDNLINQHQQKHDKLSNIKKAMLEKMFPKQGENIPEIRFKGFSGEWEEKGITDISKVFIGLVTTMTTSYRSKGVLLIRNSDIKSNRFEFSVNPIYLDEKFADENSSRRLMLGDVVTVHTGDVGTSAVVTEKEEGSIGFATIVSRPNKNIVDSNYLSVFLNTDIHKSFAINVSTGDGRANYNLKDFYKLNVPLPAVDEQAKIGNYFQKLDELINQHQQQITKLNNIKQACLSKMFV